MNINEKIYPIAYTLPAGQVHPLCYLGFPAAWKVDLLEIARKNNPRFKDEYGLPTNALKNWWTAGWTALLC